MKFILGLGILAVAFFLAGLAKGGRREGGAQALWLLKFCLYVAAGLVLIAALN